MFLGDFSGRFKLVSIENFNLSFFFDFLFNAYGRFSLLFISSIDGFFIVRLDGSINIGFNGKISTSFSIVMD